MKNIIISSLIVSLLGATSYNNDLHTSENQPYSKFKSTFIQNWYCREWTQERWEQEFYEMKSAGFDSVIIQFVCDISRGECAENKNNQDIDSYPDYLTFSMFPTDLQKNISYSSQNNGDALELALEAAKSTGVKIWLGTVNDDMWWKYGWGVPKGNYFEKWSMENAVLCSELIREMWERYGEDYEEQIAGWYDGRNDVSDLLLMKNYLLGITDVFIKNVLAGDLSENGVTDISDLCLLKYILLQ